MKKLYDRIKKEEENLKKDEEDIIRLKSLGVETTGEPLSLEERARIALEHEDYKDNTYLQEAKEEKRSLYEVMDELVTETKYSLKFKHKKRWKHNAKAAMLRNLAPSARALMVNDYRSESLMYLSASGIPVLLGIMGLSIDYHLNINFPCVGTIGLITGSSIAGLLISETYQNPEKDAARYAPGIKKQIDYIYNSLGWEQPANI